jgi:hypothetical protein
LQALLHAASALCICSRSQPSSRSCSHAAQGGSCPCRTSTTWGVFTLTPWERVGRQVRIHHACSNMLPYWQACNEIAQLGTCSPGARPLCSVR